MNALPVDPYLSPKSFIESIPAIPAAAVVLILAIFVVRFSVDIGFISFCMKTSRNEKADIKSLFDSFQFLFKVIWLGLLRLI
jgi:hypothetical protein